MVTEPVHAKAIYDPEYMVTVDAPYGASGENWYRHGEIATIEVPENPSSILLLKKVFKEFPGLPADGSILQIPVSGPVTITASYRTQVDMKSLLLALGALLAIGVIYLITQREYNRRKRRPRW